MSRRRDVVEGQQFRRLGSGNAVWEVMSVRKDSMGQSHAQLRRADDPTTRKTLSLGALLDSGEFERLNDGE